ncbi:hypothetical protein D1007_35335 [Hordeum vulgare]|nr:hypothetical protein D1007_35335 [Hordeum vulgare]
MAVAAAKILLSLRNRKLVRWSEWIPRPSDGAERAGEQEAESEHELSPIPERWPKRPRQSRLIKDDYRDEKGHLLFDLNEAWGGN